MVFSSNRRLHNIRNMCTKIKVLLSFKKLVDLIMKMLYRYPMARHNDMREHSTVLQKVCFKVKLNNWFAFSLFFTRQNAENWFKANSFLTSTLSVKSKKKGRQNTVYRVILLSYNYLPSTLANHFAQSWISPRHSCIKRETIWEIWIHSVFNLPADEGERSKNKMGSNIIFVQILYYIYSMLWEKILHGDNLTLTFDLENWMKVSILLTTGIQ